MNVFISVFTVAVDDVFAVEGVVVIEWLICSKSIGIDGERLLLVVVDRSRTVDSSADFAGIT